MFRQFPRRACWLLLALFMPHHILTERFAEELFLRPLPGGKVLAHFHFTNEMPQGADKHYRTFPKAADQLVQKFSLQELELTFTQGRWDYTRWGAAEGIAPIAAKPPGMELWSRIGGQSETEVDTTWRNLTHALSGMFCSSVNALADPATKVAPAFSFRTSELDKRMGGQKARPSASCQVCLAENLADCSREEATRACEDSLRNTGFVERQESVCPAGSKEGLDEKQQRSGRSEASEEGSVRYGALSREAVCTENLTPWLKLLPCRDKAGLATLLERRRVYGGSYHSLRIYIRTGRPWDERSNGSKDEQQCGGETSKILGGTFLEQTLTLVLGGKNVFGKGSEEVSLSNVFGRELHESCPLAGVSRVYVEGANPQSVRNGEKAVVGKGGLIHKERAKDGANKGGKKQDGERVRGPSGQLSIEALPGVGKGLRLSLPAKPEPTQVWLTNSGLKQLLDFNLKSISPDIPFDVTFPQMGEELKQAPFAVSRFVTGHGLERGGIRLELTRVLGHSKETDVRFFQLLPWFIRAYFHTLRLEMDGRHVALSDWTRDVSFVPAVDRKRQAVMELSLRIPGRIERVVLSMEFDKGYLRLEEHPPDGDRGFDLPSAVLTFSPASGSVGYHASNGSEPSDSRGVEGRPLLLKMKENLPVRIYTQGLLIPLATPDFSMPYNVITLTSTVIAMIFSSLFNVLLRKEDRNAESEVAEEETSVHTSKVELGKPTLVTRLLRSYVGVYDACWQRFL